MKSTPTTTTTFVERDLVVAFFDLSAFMRYCRVAPMATVVTNLAAYYEWVGEVVSAGGGQVVKFIGDAGLLVYPAAQADAAVNNLLRLKTEGDAWWKARNVATENILKAHCGSAFCGEFGARKDKRFDAFGEAVNTAAVLPSNGFALTPTLFRALSPATRKHFKKHTPPITYIPVGERHQ